ncbi:MAG: hypothetical protein FWC73_04735 [Defluviitaleaceae bacterium]|nr:hypothetical protein [Defluviitaleaceae bacterium]
MKIRVRSEEHRFTLPIPNCLLMNPATAALCIWAMKKYCKENSDEMFMPQDISYQDLKRLFKVIRKCRRYMRGEPLVYASSKEEGTVEIYL